MNNPRWGLAGGKVPLRLATPEDADSAAFERQYRAWTLRKRIDLPEPQLKIICAIFFNFGVAQGVKSAQAIDD